MKTAILPPVEKQSFWSQWRCSAGYQQRYLIHTKGKPFHRYGPTWNISFQMFIHT